MAAARRRRATAGVVQTSRRCLDNIDSAATCSDNRRMRKVSIRDAKNRLTELARAAEAGETIVVTRNGKPAFDLVPHREERGLRFDALADFCATNQISGDFVIADDFDEPLSEEFLTQHGYAHHSRARTATNR